MEPSDDIREASISGVTGLDDVLHPQRSRRSRALAWGATGLAVVVIAVVVLQLLRPLGFTWSLGNATSIVQRSSITPTSTIPAQIIIQTNVNFGVLFNGKAVKSLSQQGLVVVPIRGKNMLAFNAPPFTPLSCSFVWPPTYGQFPSALTPPCASNSTQTVDNTLTELPVIDFTIPLANISAPLLTSLESTIQQSLSQAADALALDVPVGEYTPIALDAQGVPISKRATQPLRARPLTTLGPVYINGCNTLLCPSNENISGAAETPPRQIFAFFISPRYHWQFTLPNGRIDHTVTMLLDGATPPYFDSVFVAYDAKNGWTMTNDPFLSSQTLDLRNLITNEWCALGMQQLSTFNNTQIGASGGTVQGCPLTLTKGTTTGKFITRFGALLAVDAAAHQLVPSLPIAPADEVAAVETT